jgi:hypothetical protein
MTFRTTLRTLSLCALLAVGPAYAAPFSVVATPASAQPGQTITVSLVFDGSAADLEAADFRLTFDGNVFDYKSPLLGKVTTIGSVSLGVGNLESSTLGGSLQQVDFSWATMLGPAGQGPLVDLGFLIKEKAPLGVSHVVFESMPLSDYVIPRIGGTVEVMAGQGGTLPEPGSLVLFALGIATLLAFSRQPATWQDANVFSCTTIRKGGSKP